MCAKRPKSLDISVYLKIIKTINNLTNYQMIN